jgi:ABC-2 type transport system ATP-binding protein
MDTMTETDQHVIEVRGLTKVFRDFWRRPTVHAVRGLDLEVRRGEIFGLLGPNGSGKSTTLKILLGLLRPTGGTARLFGETPGRVDVNRRIGYTPEASYLYGYLTAREMLDFCARLFGLHRAQRRRRVNELLAMTGLEAAADRAVGTFSKGMARRVALAQALVNNPELLILDEPTSGLDPIGCRQVKDLLGALARGGKTVLLSSHLLADVEDVCDRVLILHNGEARARGTLQDLLQERHRLRLTVPQLPAAALDEVVALLRRHAGTEPVMDHPSLNLETLFLEVIRKASPDGAAQAGDDRQRLAPFLRQPPDTEG